MKHLIYLVTFILILSSCEDPVEPVLSVSTNEISLASAADAQDSIDISSNIAWSAVSSESWLSLSTESGVGNATIILTAEENSDSEPRIATITVSGVDTEELIITVTQEIFEVIMYADSISMGAGYANDIYYSLENGEIKTSSRDDWDLAFSTNPMSSTILINEGSGVELYTYPDGDKNDWENVDISKIDQWTPQYNSDTSWLFGAFDRNSLGHPDYGWGVYNSVSHDVVGDSLFIIKLNDGSYKKLFIDKRAAVTNSYIIKYGDIADAGVTKEIPCGDYQSKNFIYFSFSSGEIADIEPDSDTWDLVFTRYHSEEIDYLVSGVLSNINLDVAEIRNTPIELVDITSAEYSRDISVIGSDWKTFDMLSSSYVIEQDLSYLVRKGSRTYQIVFTGTDGSASGTMVFDINILH